MASGQAHCCRGGYEINTNRMFDNIDVNLTKARKDNWLRSPLMVNISYKCQKLHFEKEYQKIYLK